MNIKKIIKDNLALVYYHGYRKFTSQAGNRILIYHSIGSKLAHDSYGISISKERFREHIAFLQEHYTIIALDENYQNKLDSFTLSITFDDGYKDNLYALELCEKYGIPFTFYISTGTIGQKDYVSQEDIKLFSNSPLCTIGTHGVTHRHLGTLNYEQQYYELLESKEKLEDIIGKEVLHVSYPHGSYNADTLSLVGKLGYHNVTSSHIGLNTIHTLDMKRLKRIEIIASDDITHLKRKILGYYDYLALKESSIEQ